ncbi:mariner Mos1 transposase [Trichonephila clavipes]|nr:mariner Mos1 transposase [Trichonephila clavipes]
MSAYEPNSRHLRWVLIFCFNMKKSSAKAHRMLSNTYGEAAINEKTCREWFQRFKNGDFDVEDQHGICRDQLGVVYYKLLKPTETITGDRYQTQLLNHKCIISLLQLLRHQRTVASSVKNL